MTGRGNHNPNSETGSVPGVSPSFDDILDVMSAASAGDSTARVPIPEEGQIDDPATRLGVGLNRLLDNLSARAQTAELLANRLGVLSSVSHEFAEATRDSERLLDTVAKRLAEVVKNQCVVRLLSEPLPCPSQAVGRVGHCCRIQGPRKGQARRATTKACGYAPAWHRIATIV